MRTHEQKKLKCQIQQQRIKKMSQKKHIHIGKEDEQGHDHDKHHEVEPILHEGVYSTAGKTGKSHGMYLKVMNQHKPTSQYRPITQKQLAQHHTQNSAWVSFKGIVYDATTYLKFHPGGKKLLEGTGKQCDDLVHKYHTWVNVEYLLQKYKIGYLQRAHHQTDNNLRV